MLGAQLQKKNKRYTSVKHALTPYTSIHKNIKNAADTNLISTFYDNLVHFVYEYERS